MITSESIATYRDLRAAGATMAEAVITLSVIDEVDRIIELVGPRGYVHGWRYVGGTRPATIAEAHRKAELRTAHTVTSVQKDTAAMIAASESSARQRMADLISQARRLWILSARLVWRRLPSLSDPLSGRQLCRNSSTGRNGYDQHSGDPGGSRADYAAAAHRAGHGTSRRGKSRAGTGAPGYCRQ